MKRSVNVFTEGFEKTPDSSTFDLSHEVKLTFGMGELIPVCCMEAVPGDRFEIDYVNMARLAPMIAPVMHRVRFHTEYFFVPNRILWEGWEDFITGIGSEAAPWIEMNDIYSSGTLADYLGVPPGDYTNQPIKLSAIQVAAYYKIYDDWYRDQNQQSEQFTPLVAGDNGAYHDRFVAPPLKRAWEHDYFTSALPTSQQGTDVEIPLTFQDNVPVEFVANSLAGIIKTPAGGNAGGLDLGSENATPSYMEAVGGGQNLVYDPNGTLVVDIQSDAATINDLREAFSLQAFLEKSIRGGLRYIEQIWSHFRVKSSDARLQRAEMIGRSTQNIVISEVLATAQSNNDGATAEVAVGSMAGHGISVGGNERVSFYAEEHGFVIGIISVLPDTAYQDGLHKSFFRFDRLDYLWPEFANLGEQSILAQELMCHDLDGTDDPLQHWGYVPRYSEYRFMNSRVAGEFRDSLAFWHMGRIFQPGAIPGLNVDFIQADPTTRIFAVEEGVDHIYAQVINRVKVNRKLPRFGIPSTLG